MRKIDSFKVNHQKLERGIYVSKIDGDIITLDLRIRKPYADAVLTDAEMHSLEHLLATALRNSEFGGNVIYVGPMGCATGFYVLFRALSEAQMLKALKISFKGVLDFSVMPGDSEFECGNCNTLDLKVGKNLTKECLAILECKSGFDKYPT